jgi:TctA family transporter
VEVLSNLALGFSVAFSVQNVLYCFLGAVLGTLIGVLPGVGPTATIAMLLPLTVTLEPSTSLIMLAGIYYGAQYGGSTTAILINLPGEASSAVTALDGYQMARQGRAGAALSIAALGSLFAGCVATVVIAFAAPPLTTLALSFSPVEYFSLMVLGLIASVTLAHGSVLKSLAMVVMGVAIGLVGTDVYTGERRLTLGFLELADGFDFVVVAIGIFGMAEILRNLEGHEERSVMTRKISNLMPSLSDLKQSIGPVLRGTAIGSVLGILPGGGALLSSFASYTVEKKLSSTPEQFGQGAIAGVAGPESANNAGAQTSFIPMLSLGIPSNPVMALMIGAMIIQGIVPGPQIMTEQPDLFWGLIASMLIGNVLLVVLNLPLIGIWVRLLDVPYHVLVPIIMILSMIGIFAVAGNTFPLYLLSLFGLFGYLLSKLSFEPAPLLLGFVIGPLLEENLRRAMIIADGDATVFLTRPISAALLGVAVILLVLVALPSISKKREEVFLEG